MTDGPTRWPWELNRYGVDLGDPGFIRSRRYFLRRGYLKQAHIDREFAERLIAPKWNQAFPVVGDAVICAQSLGLLDGGDFACVHVRRGDYLKVSSRVVSFEESLHFVARTSLLLPRRIIFLSDQAFSDNERLSAMTLLPRHDCIFYSHDDQHVVHGIMRLSNVLITSNSTFSWTAALLASDPANLAFSPQDFFGSGMEALNAVFRRTSKWMIIG